MLSSDNWHVDFPTLADVIDAWIQAHCKQPDGFNRGKPFVLADWQFWLAANRWRIREDAKFVPPEEVTTDNPMVLNQAFTYRQTLCVAPQKTGKGPCAAAFVAAEAVGPTVFNGWAKKAMFTVALIGAALVVLSMRICRVSLWVDLSRRRLFS